MDDLLGVAVVLDLEVQRQHGCKIPRRGIVIKCCCQGQIVDPDPEGGGFLVRRTAALRRGRQARHGAAVRASPNIARRLTNWDVVDIAASRQTG